MIPRTVRRCALPAWLVGVWLWLLGGPSSSWAQAPVRLRYDAWRLQWAEEFNTPLDTTELAQRWRFDFPWGRSLLGLESEYYTSRQLHVQDGTLRLRAERLATPIDYRGKKLGYEAAMLFSHGPADTLRPVRCPEGGGFSYGLFEIRCRQPHHGAAFPAFWLYGGAPDEIDIFEATADGFGNTTHLNPNNFWRSLSRKTESCSCFYYATQPYDLHQQFHTYSLSWMPGELVFYFDGIPIRRETRYAPLGCGMELIANLAMWDWAKTTRDSLEIDYLRVYRPSVERVAAAMWPRIEPQADFEYAPWLVPPGSANQTSRQHWVAGRTAQGVFDLALVDNENPRCDSNLPLPRAGRWTPPWLQLMGESDIYLRVAGDAPLRWQARRLGNAAVAAAGEIAPGPAQQLTWSARLPAGVYTVTLQLGSLERTQRLYVFDVPPRPAAATP